ncbi:hypothetical protein QQ045_010089 [Rhodiola kirilowii]
MDSRPRCPSFFFNRNFISGIVSSFGSFLDVDARKKTCSTLRYVRACVEVDVTKAIPKKVRHHVKLPCKKLLGKSTCCTAPDARFMVMKLEK